MLITRVRAVGASAIIMLTAGGAAYGLTRSSTLCRASEPASWRAAASSAARYTWTPRSDAAVWTAFPDGTLVVDRPGPDDTNSLLAVSASGTSRTLLTLPAHQDVYTLDARADWAVVTYFARDALSHHPIRYTATVAVNVRDGATTGIAGRDATVTEVPAGFDTAALASFDVDRTGTVWYATGSPSRPVLHRYDLRTGRAATVARAPGGHRQAPGVGAALDGVYWVYGGNHDTDGGTGMLAVALQLPAPVTAAYGHRTIETLTTDGRAYAWTTGDELSWWQPGMHAPKRVDLSDADDEHTFGVDIVAGPIVTAFSGEEGNGRTVIDMRTGADLVNPSITRGAGMAVTPTRLFTETDGDTRAATVHAIRTPLPALHC